MDKNGLMPLLNCLDVNFSDKNSLNTTALHETGHVLVMYALGMMDSFLDVTINGGPAVNEMTGGANQVKGLTEVTEDYKDALAKHSSELLRMATSLKSGKDVSTCLYKTKVDSANLYLPNICRLFGGGAICRYYGVPDEAICSIDYSYIDTLLLGLGMTGSRDTIIPLVDMYLKPIFQSFDLLTKAIYKNLCNKGTLNKTEVMHIIEEWEHFRIA